MCNCWGFAEILARFWRNSPPTLLQLLCNLHLRSGAACCDLGRRKISNAYRYQPGAEWKRDRAPAMTNQARKNTRRKDAWRKLAQWPGRRDLAVSRFPIFQPRLSHALNIPFLKGIVKGFFEGWRGNWHKRLEDAGFPPLVALPCRNSGFIIPDSPRCRSRKRFSTSANPAILTSKSQRNWKKQTRPDMIRPGLRNAFRQVYPHGG